MVALECDFHITIYTTEVVAPYRLYNQAIFFLLFACSKPKFLFCCRDKQIQLSPEIPRVMFSAGNTEKRYAPILHFPFLCFLLLVQSQFCLTAQAFLNNKCVLSSRNTFATFSSILQKLCYYVQFNLQAGQMKIAFSLALNLACAQSLVASIHMWKS